MFVRGEVLSLFHAGSRTDTVITSLTFLLSIFIKYPAPMSLFSIKLKGNHEVVVTILIENSQTMDKDKGFNFFIVSILCWSLLIPNSGSKN